MKTNTNYKEYQVEVEVYATREQIKQAILGLQVLLDNEDLPNEMIFHNGKGMQCITVNKIDEVI